MIQSVDRAVRVLTALQGSRRMALSELATRLELPPSTVHGLIRTLVAHGLVVQERGSTRYQLGPAVLRLGNVYLDTIELRSKAVPWAEDIARRTGFAVRTAVLLLDDVVIIHHEPRPDGSRQMPEVGHGERRVTVHDQGRGHGPDPDEHEERGAEELGRQALQERGFVVHGSLHVTEWRSTLSNVWRRLHTGFTLDKAHVRPFPGATGAHRRDYRR